jgi:hypothetical protein
MVTINATVTNDTASGLYRVVAVVTAATDITQSVFVFDTVTAAFSRVATASDIGSYPTDRATAQTNNAPYYLQPAVTRSFVALSDAGSFSESIQPRLKTLAKDHQAALDDFLGTTNLVVTSE